MRKWLLPLVVTLTLTLTGCGNLSPRMQEKIDNQNGKIGEIENINQGLKLELGKLQNQAEIQNSQLDRVQQGLMNVQAGNENSGVQILSGTGGVLIACFITIAAVVIALSYRNEAKKQQKAAEIMAQQIAYSEDPELEDNVFRAAMNTDVEAQIYNAVTKHQMLAQRLKAMSKV